MIIYLRTNVLHDKYHPFQAHPDDKVAIGHI